jgi:hypothetical protein
MSFKSKEETDLSVSSFFQSVKKAPNRQNVSLSVWVFLFRKDKPNNTDFQTFSHKKLAARGVLTYCANRMTTVPLYAYAFGLLVFGAPLTSVSLSKKSFLTDCKEETDLSVSSF